MDNLMWRALSKIKSLPDQDLFHMPILAISNLYAPDSFTSPLDATELLEN
jgi:hypothetical protein